VRVVKIMAAYCKGCGLCVWACPEDSLGFSPDFNAIGIHPASFKENAECTGCQNCVAMCPQVAIEIYEVSADEPP
jgi:2-oxoglutarate ferredoxin oxidoreductase subunit delta